MGQQLSYISSSCIMMIFMTRSTRYNYTRQMLKALRGEPEKYKLRYIGVKAACV